MVVLFTPLRVSILQSPDTPLTHADRVGHDLPLTSAPAGAEPDHRVCQTPPTSGPTYSYKLVQLKQALRWIDEITEERYKEAREEIDDDMNLGDDPNEAMVHACFEVDANATAWLSVSKDLLPVMRGADYRPNLPEPPMAPNSETA